MRILKGLNSRVLACGCVAGIYETYDSEVVAIIDARAASCADPTHERGKQLPFGVPAPVRNTSSDRP
jgi:hypothetical protein